MRIRGFDFKWFDGFFLSMLATSVIVVSMNWKRYHSCAYPLHIWIVVDYATVFIFRVLMFLDNGLASGMGVDANEEERNLCFRGRIAVLSCLAFFLYPFLWAWTVIGSLWYRSTNSCLPEEGQKWGFLIWLVFSYWGLFSIACISVAKWLLRRQSHMLLVPPGTAPLSEFDVLVELIRVPNLAARSLSNASQELPIRSSSSYQELPIYHPGLYLTPLQREAVEGHIELLPKFRLKAVPSDCSSCPICLDEFEVGTEVRGLPCGHNFHMACIDEWLRLNVKCPHCRSNVFPNLDLASLVQPSSTATATTDGSRRGTSGVGTVFVSMSSGGLSRTQTLGNNQGNMIRWQDMVLNMQIQSDFTVTASDLGQRDDTGRAMAAHADDMEDIGARETGR